MHSLVLMNILDSRVQKPQCNKNGEDLMEKMISSHNMLPQEWGWAINEINSFVLLKNAFPNENDATTFIENDIIDKLFVIKSHVDLTSKVSAMSLMCSGMVLVLTVIILLYIAEARNISNLNQGERFHPRILA